jgi:hypothetical protein
MSFCTAINCMDGRTQEPVIDYMRRRCRCDHVDSVTEPGPVCILADESPADLVESIFQRVEVSVQDHESRHIAIVAHHDCAGNPADKPMQLEQLKRALPVVRERFPDAEVFGLWVDERWTVTEVGETDAVGV